MPNIYMAMGGQAEGNRMTKGKHSGKNSYIGQIKYILGGFYDFLI
jgi:hypothetical protein